MTKQRAEALIRKRIGEIPILQTVIQRLRLREIVLSYIKPHGNETVPAVDTLLVLVWNLIMVLLLLSRLPTMLMGLLVIPKVKDVRPFLVYISLLLGFLTTTNF